LTILREVPSQGAETYDSGMRGLVQRVRRASVTVEGDAGAEVVGAIACGLCVLVGVTHSDTAEQARKLADKVWNLRVFDDAAGVMNLSLADTAGEVLVVSQFTLYADTARIQGCSTRGRS